MIKLIVFDMAGTTIDENNVVYKTLQNVINKAGYDFSLEMVLKHGAGKEKLQAIKDIIGILKTDDVVEKESTSIFADFSQLLKKNYEKLSVKTFPDTEKLFQELKNRNIKIVLNTGYDRKTALLLLSKLKWIEGTQYDALITASDVEESRPKPAMIYKAMEIFNIKNSKDVMKVGDSIIDIEEGKAANCGITVGVTTGAHTIEQLQSATPTYIMNSLLEILEVI